MGGFYPFRLPMYYAQLLFPEFLLIVCGYLVCRFTDLNRSVWQQVDSLVYFFLFPVLLFHSVIRSPLDLRAASSLIAAAVSLVALGIAASYSVARWPKVQSPDFVSTAQIGFRFNSFIALTVVDKLAGKEGLLLMAVVIGVCVPVCNIGAVWPMARNSGVGFGKALLRNPLIIATASGLLANVLGASIPAWIEPSVTRIGQASLALGLLAAGAGMQVRGVFNTASRRVAGVGMLGIRHLAMPLFAWGLVRVFNLNPVQATVLLTYSALPTASSSYVLATKMGFDGSFAAGLVTLSIALGALSLPFALEFLR